MSAGFSPASLRRLRSWATGLMTDECRIVSHGRPVTDPHTGKATSPEKVRYEGRCKVQTSGGLAAENTEGGIVQALGAVTPCGRSTCICPTGPRACLRRRGRDHRGHGPEPQGQEVPAAEHAVRENARHRMPVERQGSRQQQ